MNLGHFLNERITAVFPAMGGDALVDVARIVAIVPFEDVREGAECALILDGFNEPYTIELSCSTAAAVHIRAEAIRLYEERVHAAHAVPLAAAGARPRKENR